MTLGKSLIHQKWVVASWCCPRSLFNLCPPRDPPAVPGRFIPSGNLLLQCGLWRWWGAGDTNEQFASLSDLVNRSLLVWHGNRRCANQQSTNYPRASLLLLFQKYFFTSPSFPWSQGEPQASTDSSGSEEKLLQCCRAFFPSFFFWESWVFSPGLELVISAGGFCKLPFSVFSVV